MKTLLLRYPHKNNHRRRDQANVPVMEHRRHWKRRVVESFPAERSLMHLLCGLLLYLAEIILMRDRPHDDVTLVHRSCVALPHSARKSQKRLHVRCLQRSKGQELQKMRSHTRQSTFSCGEDADGARVDFQVRSSDNFVCSYNLASGNVLHQSLGEC